MVNIKLVKTHKDAVLPKVNNQGYGVGDSGYDLTAVEDAWISTGSSKVVPVGLHLAYITPGYWFRIEGRSGLGFKSSVQPHLGVIDNGYRGDLGVKLYNFHETNDLQVKSGDRIAQIVVYPLIQPEFEFAEDVTDSARGDKGFGSSDISGLPPLRARVRDVTRPPFTITQDQANEDSSTLPNFESAYDLFEYAKKTDMPDDIFEDFLRNKVWERNR